MSPAKGGRKAGDRSDSAEKDAEVKRLEEQLAVARGRLRDMEEDQVMAAKKVRNRSTSASRGVA